jgi:hypothetical protein
MPLDPQAWGVVNTSSDGILGLQMIPLRAIDAPPIHSWPSASPTRRSVPGPVKCSASKRLPVQPVDRSRRRALWSAHAATGSA